ncbi:MAG: metallophosphoesterase family protein [Bacteroidetes bacterium]|nr:metallophosphoesterase family protein [Bacteroidota bacterium]
MTSYAIISDIHGNSLAFEAVLRDIKIRGIEKIINLGDHFFGALEPEAVAAMIRESNMLCISGNTDREILQSIDGDFDKEGMDRVKADLSQQSISWLRKLPKTASLDGLFFICHGTPESDDEYLLEKVTANGVFVHNDEDLVNRTAGISERIVLCGHSHVNRVVYLSNDKVILNPGSVGLPAYLGNGQHRFAMESNTPHAKYAIVHADGGSISIEQVLCAYDWHRASEAARKNGNEKWANFLLYGRMPKDLRVEVGSQRSDV